MESTNIPTMAQMAARGEEPEILFWVGCVASFDQRAQRITRALCDILQHAEIKFAVLGIEESCTGDPAKRAGNEFLFQMQAMMNIQTLNAYGIKRIVTACPHCFNIIKNEYPELGGNFEVIHHSTLIEQLIQEGRIKTENGTHFNGKRITFHDPCYLGRGNKIYEAPRKVLETLDADLAEMKRCKANGLCCGAGGAQLFKESEPGNKEINIERTEEALATGCEVIATACPFCMIMLRDGIKQVEKEESIEIQDIAEMIANGLKPKKIGLPE